MTSDQLTQIVAIATGTTGLTIFLLYFARLLGVLHVKQDEDVIRQRDKAERQRDDAIATLREGNAGLEQMAEGLASVNTSVQSLKVTVDKLARGAKVKEP